MCDIRIITCMDSGPPRLSNNTPSFFGFSNSSGIKDSGSTLVEATIVIAFSRQHLKILSFRRKDLVLLGRIKLNPKQQQMARSTTTKRRRISSHERLSPMSLRTASLNFQLQEIKRIASLPFPPPTLRNNFEMKKSMERTSPRVHQQAGGTTKVNDARNTQNQIRPTSSS